MRRSLRRTDRRSSFKSPGRRSAPSYPESPSTRWSIRSTGPRGPPTAGGAQGSASHLRGFAGATRWLVPLSGRDPGCLPPGRHHQRLVEGGVLHPRQHARAHRQGQHQARRRHLRHHPGRAGGQIRLDTAGRSVQHHPSPLVGKGRDKELVVAVVAQGGQGHPLVGGRHDALQGRRARPLQIVEGVQGEQLVALGPGSRRRRQLGGGGSASQTRSRSQAFTQAQLSTPSSPTSTRAGRGDRARGSQLPTERTSSPAKASEGRATGSRGAAGGPPGAPPPPRPPPCRRPQHQPPEHPGPAVPFARQRRSPAGPPTAPGAPRLRSGPGPPGRAGRAGPGPGRPARWGPWPAPARPR